MINKKKPLAVDMLSYLEDCKKYYDEEASRVNDGSDKKEYSLDLQYITAFALIGIFKNLEQISMVMRANREDET